jgi:HEAT repeat-containing protein 5
MLHAVGTLLKTNNPHMLRAVDGLDTSPSSTDSQSLISTKGRDEPALFFWVLFGLSFEALCGGRPSVQAIALDALVGLMRTEVSGSALLEASLFEELCNLCYRLAITEGPEIKQRVMEIVLVLAGNFAKEASKKEGGATR